MSGFLDAVKAAPLLWDGAMGSLLYERGVFFTRSFDELNLSSPELIEKVHREYVDAGADVLETNTFGANRLMLARHGHADKVREINLAGVRLARAAARDARYPVYVAGSVGPSGIPWGESDGHACEEATTALREQVALLAGAEVDTLLLETFYHLGELEAAVRSARAEVGPAMSIVAQLVFGEDGRSRCGVGATEVARRLRDAGADVIGANCGIGPGELLEIGTQMIAAGLPVSLQPNAGLPRTIEGRTLYIANPEHFGVWARRALQAGVRMVGGCCGTTPEHTRRMLGAVRMIGVRPMPSQVTGGAPAGASAAPVARPPVPSSQRSRLGAKLARGEFAVSCELSSPAGTDPSRTLDAARRLAAGGIDLVNIADGPRATARLANSALCNLLERETAVETLLHVCCRDRNFIGLVAHLLGAHAMGQRNLVIITGDPPKLGDYPFATPVYDVDSIGLLRIAADLNRGLDPAGKQIPGQTSFLLATGAEPAALDYDRELRRLEDKKAAGAELIMTQPVYDARLVERFLDDTRSFGLPILVGLLPLASHRNAEFLHNNVPGMQIPAEIRSRMARAGQGPSARAEGVKIAREALGEVRSRVAGAYIMPPFDRVESALEIVSGFLPPAGEGVRPSQPATAPA